MENLYTLTFAAPGALSANWSPTFKVPFDVQLIHVSIVGSNANDATLAIGYTGALTAYMTAKAFGDSGTVVEKALADFVGAQFPHIADGAEVVLTVDYDGASGTAIQNACIVLTFTKG